MGLIKVMDACQQDTLFEMPEPTSAAVIDGWQARMDKLTEMAQSKGGLMPRSVVHDTLGISRNRVYELVQEGRLEVVNFFGVQFVTGRSLREYEAAGKLPGGRGRKANGLWKNLSIGARIGSDLGHAVGLMD